MKESEIALKVAEIEVLAIESEGEALSIQEHVSSIDLSTPEGVDAANMLLDRIPMIADYHAKVAKRHAAVARGLERAYEFYKDSIKEAMKVQGMDELHGHEMRLKLSKAKAALVIEDENKVLETYKKVEVSVDKTRLREDLELGVPVEGAKLEPSFSLRSYPQKKSRVA